MLLGHITVGSRPGSLTVTPDVSGIDEGTGGILGATATVTVTPTGGTAPYTYAWSVLANNGDPGTDITIDSATTDATVFNYTGLNFLGDMAEVDVRCDVEDAMGSTGYTTITVRVTRTS